MLKSSLAAAALGVFVLAFGNPATAGPTAAQKCDSGKLKATGQKAVCEMGADAKAVLKGATADFSKCKSKFAGSFTKLEAKGGCTIASGDTTTIESKVDAFVTDVFDEVTEPRFVDNGDGTVTDHQTGLQWVKTNNKDNVADYANPQDADNLYSWGDLTGCTFSGCPNGSVFTDYLGRLNACSSTDGSAHSFDGFAGHCDWRLPTSQELQTIIDLSAPMCGSGSPCIDAIFGPTVVANPMADLFYWSSTTLAGGSSFAWRVDFGTGSVVFTINKGASNYVRAVRGGP